MRMSDADIMAAEGPREMTMNVPAFTVTEAFSPIQNLTPSYFRTKENFTDQIENPIDQSYNHLNWKERTGRSWGYQPTVGRPIGTGPGYSSNSPQGISTGRGVPYLQHTSEYDPTAFRATHMIGSREDGQLVTPQSAISGEGGSFGGQVTNSRNINYRQDTIPFTGTYNKETPMDWNNHLAKQSPTRIPFDRGTNAGYSVAVKDSQINRYNPESVWSPGKPDTIQVHEPIYTESINRPYHPLLNQAHPSDHAGKALRKAAYTPVNMRTGKPVLLEGLKGSSHTSSSHSSSSRSSNSMPVMNESIAHTTELPMSKATTGKSISDMTQIPSHTTVPTITPSTVPSTIPLNLQTEAPMKITDPSIQPIPLKPALSNQLSVQQKPTQKLAQKKAVKSNSVHPINRALDLVTRQKGMDDSLDLLSGNQVLIDRRPININIDYHGPGRQPWEKTPDYYDRQFDDGMNNNGYSSSNNRRKWTKKDDNSCYGNNLDYWYQTNGLRDLDPPSTIDGDRIYLSGRRWRQGNGLRESMTDTMLYPDQRTPMDKAIAPPNPVKTSLRMSHAIQADPVHFQGNSRGPMRDSSRNTFNRVNHIRM